MPAIPAVGGTCWKGVWLFFSQIQYFWAVGVHSILKGPPPNTSETDLEPTEICGRWSIDFSGFWSRLQWCPKCASLCSPTLLQFLWKHGVHSLVLAAGPGSPCAFIHSSSHGHPEVFSYLVFQLLTQQQGAGRETARLSQDSHGFGFGVINQQLLLIKRYN